MKNKSIFLNAVDWYLVVSLPNLYWFGIPIEISEQSEDWERSLLICKSGYGKGLLSYSISVKCLYSQPIFLTYWYLNVNPLIKRREHWWRHILVKIFICEYIGFEACSWIVPQSKNFVNFDEMVLRPSYVDIRSEHVVALVPYPQRNSVSEAVSWLLHLTQTHNTLCVGIVKKIR